MSGYLENGDASQSMRNCRESRRLDSASRSAAGAAARWIYARALYYDPGATLNDRREAVNTLEDAERIARRVLGTAHPVASGIERELQKCRAALTRVTD